MLSLEAKGAIIVGTRRIGAADIAEVVTTFLKLETVTGENTRVDSGRHLAGSEVE